MGKGILLAIAAIITFVVTQTTAEAVPALFLKVASRLAAGS